MRAVIYDEFGGPLRVESVPDPSPPDDGVVVRVQATGLCRSDWHGWQGHDADITSLPHVPGHEFAGIVVAVGRQVEQFAEGDYVTTPFVGGCGQCLLCRSGHAQVCDAQYQPGFSGWGSFADAVALRYADANLIRLPETLAPGHAASLGCRLGTAYRAVAEVGGVGPGEWAAVHGCGGLGLAAIGVVVALGGRAIAVDLEPSALDWARRLGAEATVDATAEDAVDQVRAIAGGHGVALSLDTAGNVQAAANSIRSLRKRGRHVQVGLLAGVDQQQPLPMELVIARELQILGSHGIAAASYGKLLDLLAAGKINPSQLIGQTISLDDVPAAMTGFGKTTGPGMTIIDMNRAG